MKRALGGVLCATWVSLAAPDSRACGGCFNPPSSVTLNADSVVTGHRMAFAVAGDRTVLWDQIQYTGAPEDFAWVLPIKPGAYVEASTDAWFETLDVLTTAHVTAPNVQCAVPESSGGCGFGSSSDSKSFAGAQAGGDFGSGVHVIHEGTVGPYDTVTLTAANGDSLRTWLGSHGYVIPPDIDPVIDSYVAEGADFIALRLSPGQGVQAMQPVRVVTPGGPAMLPLRMVAAGTGAFVNIVLFVIGEGRYLLQDFKETFIDETKLTFDMSANTTNYLAVREDALGKNGGYSFLTAYANPGLFPPNANASYTTTNGSGSVTSFPELYFQQAADDDQRALAEACLPAVVALGSNLLVGDGTDGTLDAATLTCSGYSDLSTALVGLHPSRIWLTRLELDLPREALSADCKVSVHPTQSAVSGNYTATRVVNRTSGCPEPVFESSVIPRGGSSAAAFFWGMAAFAGLFGLRRVRTVRR